MAETDPKLLKGLAPLRESDDVTRISEREQEWIAKRRKRWQILVDLRRGEISITEAERRLRVLDAGA